MRVQTDRPGGVCLSLDEGLYIEGFSSDWAVLDGAHQNANGVNLYTRGEVTTYDEEAVIKPLTASFGFGTGYVLYSSYHSEEYPSEGLLPQERVLQYLIFE